MKKLAIALVLAVGLLTVGCSTVPDEYVPATVGSIGDPDTLDGLKMTISTTQTNVYIGQPVVFQVRIQNVGSIPLFIPKKPNVVLTWVYADGSRDNFVKDFEGEPLLDENDLTILQPNRFITKDIRVNTYYFNRAGVTEFWATFQTWNRKASAKPGAWEGRIMSNRFGVWMESGKTIAAARQPTSRF